MLFLFDIGALAYTEGNAKCNTCPFAKGLSSKLDGVQNLRIGTTGSKLLIIGGAIGSYAYMNKLAVIAEFIKPVVDLIPVEFTVDYLPVALCYSENTEKIDAATICCAPNIQTLTVTQGYDYIVPMGSLAIRALLGTRNQYSSADVLWRGNCMPDSHFEAFVVPTLAYRGVVGEAQPIWALIKDDITLNVEYGRPLLKYAPNIVLNDSILDNIVAGDTIAFDYETSGLKPDNKGHFIYSISICKINCNTTYSFLLTDTNKAKWQAILGDKAIQKVAHNIKMEERWSRDILNTPVANWVWDTCIGAHCINSMQGNSGLKFQAFANFGASDYSSHLDRYIKCGGSNAFNDIRNAPVKELLTYGAFDAYYTAMLYPIQQRVLCSRFNASGKPFAYGVKLFTQVQRAFAVMESNGVKIDSTKLAEYELEIENKRQALISGFRDTPLYATWDKSYGNKLDLGADAQLSYILFDVLGYKAPKTTKSGKNSLDEEALTDLGIADLDGYIRIKKYNKLTGTYYAQFKREIDENSLIHCDLRLNSTRTFRTSCTNPNLQNISRTDKEQAFYTRSLFLPVNKDFVIIEADLKGCEVSGAACHTRDKNLLAYVSDPSLDMHRDIGEILYKVDKSLISKDLRSITKMYTFGSFYGDYYKGTGPNIYKSINMLQPKLMDGTPVTDYLRDRGLGNIETFTKHVQTADDYLWNQQFPGYSRWKRDMVEFYNEHGYIDMFTGFRRYGPMDKKQVVNTPIQGDSGHINLWLCCYILNRLHTSGIPACIFMQIHDSILGAVHPDYLDEYCGYYKDGIAALRKQWEWMICPFEIEFEVSHVGGSWFDKKEYKLK